MASCSQCSTEQTNEKDDNLPGPLGVKYDDHGERLDVTLAIPGVKKPGPFNKSHRSCVVDAKFESESLRILVQLNPGGGKIVGARSQTVGGKYLYKIKRLPDKIIPESSSFRLGKNKVVVCLRKLKHGSWQHILDTSGLETSDD